MRRMISDVLIIIILTILILISYTCLERKLDGFSPEHLYENISGAVTEEVHSKVK